MVLTTRVAPKILKAFSYKIEFLKFLIGMFSYPRRFMGRPGFINSPLITQGEFIEVLEKGMELNRKRELAAENEIKNNALTSFCREKIFIPNYLIVVIQHSGRHIAQKINTTSLL